MGLLAPEIMLVHCSTRRNVKLPSLINLISDRQSALSLFAQSVSSRNLDTSEIQPSLRDSISPRRVLT